MAGGRAGEKPGKTAGSPGDDTGGAGGRDQPGRGGQLGRGGVGSDSGGGGYVSPDGGLGGYVPYCGGCEPYWYEVRCSSSQVPSGTSHGGEGDEDASAACAAAIRDSGHSNGGQGGAPQVSPGLCETYVARERVEEDVGGCIAVEEERHAGECHVGGECCVVVERISCGV